MRARLSSRRKKAQRLRARAVWFCMLSGLFAAAIIAGSGERGGLAQSTPSPGGSPAPTHQTQAVPAAANTVTEIASNKPSSPESHDTITDPKTMQIADDSANLLKLANSLKIDVDKTTADTLSLSAVREAEEIEKLARKMRKK